MVSRALLVVALSSTVSSPVLTTLLTITLLLFKGWLIWAAFNRAELVGILTRGSLFSLSLLPDQSCSSSDLGEVQIRDLLLAHELGDAVHGWRELCHNDHGLEMFWNLQPGCDNSGEMGDHFVDTEGGILMVGHLGLDRSSELKVGGDNPRFPIGCLQGGPENSSILHCWVSIVSLDRRGQAQGNVPYCLRVIVLPVLDLFPVLIDLILVGQGALVQRFTILVQSNIIWTGAGEYTPLTLRHKEAFHGRGPNLVVGTSEDRDKGGEAGRHGSC